MMTSYLLTQGHKVQRQRVRDSLFRIDESSVRSRRKRKIARRTYKVPHPNYMWHIDGHMKLIRWGIATHAGIDGYSRLIVFLHAATNNRASTVFKDFLHATVEFGLPSLVRSDRGGENKLVALFMNLVRGVNHHITGKSVHNQRVERLWRDVHEQVTQEFYKEFYKLEDQGKLDINSSSHMQALQTIYIPELNKRLSTFQSAWNKHKIRTGHNKTPEQIWMKGCFENPGKDCYTAMTLQLLENGLSNYGLTMAQFQDIDHDPEPQAVELPEFDESATIEQKFISVRNLLQQ